MTLLGFSILTLAQILFAAFNGILFTQSGLNKVFDYQGNLSYLRDYFKASPFASWVGVLMPTITVLEVAAGGVSLLGTVLLLLDHDSGSTFGAVGMLLGAVSMTSLFLGQRIAKDYAGAAGSVPYFLMTVVGLLLYHF
ncbi:MAG: DoxX family protein [Runella sp.]